MKKFFFLMGFFCAINAQAQISISVTIDTQRDTFRISPYIYGTNGQADRELNITARRQGGNRMSGYNWETNASHAGTDYLNQNDNYLPWIMKISSGEENIPGIVTTAFHDTSRRHNAYSLVTLQAAGYVAADKGGPVDQSATAPSFRFNEVKFAKGGNFSLTPDLTDNVVYVDEFVNYLKEKFGAASSGGINGYAIDNEPGIWHSTHPRIHPQKVTVAEAIEKNISLAKAVKSVDPSAEIFGGVMYGFSEFFNLQEASDWSQYSSEYDWYISKFLDTMWVASQQNGMRLMDVLDLHWYPEARGKNSSGNDIRITENDTSRGVSEARMQAPRSLWDSSYKENSWIGQWFSPVALIPHIQSSIGKYFPGTKIAFTEFQYGPNNHISTGIAIADVLGIHGKYGVYMSNHWGDLTEYSAAAYKIYRNYDGNFSSYGNIGVHAETSDKENSSVYASYEEGDDSTLHVIVINKNFDQPVAVNFSLNSKKNFSHGELWSFTRDNFNIEKTGEISSIAYNSFSATIQPLTVAHLVLRKKEITSDIEEKFSSAFTITPNPAQSSVNFSCEKENFLSLTISDAAGNIIREWKEISPDGKILFDGKNSSQEKISSGMYFAILKTKSGVRAEKFLFVQ